MAKTTIFFLLLINLIWSLALYFEPTHTTFGNYAYNVSYGLSFLIAGIISFFYIKKYPQNKSIWWNVVISSTLFFIAQFIWAYYNIVLHSEIPFPSLADFFWISFYIFNLGLVFNIFKSLKINLNWAVLLEVLLTFSVIFSISHSFVTINSYELDSTLATKILNIAYPLFDSLLVALFLSVIRSTQGRFKPALLFFTTAFFVFTVGDSLFTYQTSLETYWNGNFVDALYAISGYLYALGIINLPQILNSDDTSDILTSQDI